MEEMTLEQRKALALAKARRKRAEEGKGSPDRFKALTGGINRGISTLLGLPVDTAENIYNLGAAGVGTVAGLAGRPDLMPEPISGTALGSQWIENKLNQSGIGTKNPAPEDPASRMLYTGGNIAGGSFFPGATLKNTLGAAVGGAVGGEMGGQTGTMVGAMTPGALGAGATLGRQALASRTAPRVDTFKRAGAPSTLGTATDIPFFHGIENLMSRFPGSSGIIQRFREQVQSGVGAQARTGVSAERAGRAIEEGIKREGGFLARTSNKWQQLDDALATQLKKKNVDRMFPSATLKALNKLSAPVKGAERSTEALSNPKLVRLREQIVEDVQTHGGYISLEGIRKIRSDVGALMDDALVSDVPRGQLKALYAALSDDIRQAAKDAGALKQFNRQNAYYRARMDRIDNVLSKVIGKTKQPEDIFRAIDPKDPDAAGKLTATLRSLTPSERRTVTNAVVNRLGRAKPGAQDEMGDMFSTETFLTNWNRISARAKAMLFPDPVYRENMDKIARVAAEIRFGSEVFKNASGTAGSFAAYGIYTSPFIAIAAGDPMIAIGAAATAGGANLGAKLVTNQKFINWLAKAPPDPKLAPVHFSRLAAIYNETDDPEIRQALEAYVQKANQMMGAQ